METSVLAAQAEALRLRLVDAETLQGVKDALGTADAVVVEWLAVQGLGAPQQPVKAQKDLLLGAYAAPLLHRALQGAGGMSQALTTMRIYPLPVVRELGRTWLGDRVLVLDGSDLRMAVAMEAVDRAGGR